MEPRAYVYLLGLYLGDGCLGAPRLSATGTRASEFPSCERTGRTYQLRITLDARYPEIVESAVAAMMAVVPHRRVQVRARPGARVVESGWKLWPELFPQHGPGKKHTRTIALGGWQRALVDHYPFEFLRGLIHSDGCRVVNRFDVALPSGRRVEYAYPRYFFSNLSADLRELFTEYCDRIGVRCTQSNHRNMSVADRRSVAILDGFIGEKR